MEASTLEPGTQPGADGSDPDGYDPDALASAAGDSSGADDDFAPAAPLPGFEDLIGGNEPTGSTIRLLGGAVEIDPPEGGFKKGAVYVVRIEARCDEISFRDERDPKTRQVVGTKKATKLKITDASLA